MSAVGRSVWKTRSSGVPTSALCERSSRPIRSSASLDALRVDLGMSKAELARRINRNASSIRRLFTASSSRPELPLIAAIADALGAEVRVVPKTPASKRSTRRRREPAAA